MLRHQAGMIPVWIIRKAIKCLRCKFRFNIDRIKIMAASAGGHYLFAGLRNFVRGNTIYNTVPRLNFIKPENVIA